MPLQTQFPATFLAQINNPTIVSPLLDDLIVFYPLKSDANDAHINAEHLTNNNAVVFDGTSATFVSANNTSLSRALDSLLQLGDVSFTIAVDVYFTTNTADMYIFDEYSALSFALVMVTLTKQIQFAIGAFVKTISGPSNGAVTGQWIRIIAWRDKDADVIGLQINNGTTLYTVASGNFAPVSNGSLRLGNLQNAPNAVNGKLRAAALWKGRVLTAFERWAWHNGGTPLDYPLLYTPGQFAYSFERHGTTPIIPLGTTGTWDSVDITNPDVFWDAPNNRWVMNYSGWNGTSWRTGLAYSTDLVTWTKEASNPVWGPEDWNPAGDAYITANGSIVLKGSTYYLYFQYKTIPRIYCATSTDLLNWTIANGGNPVINVDGTDTTLTADPFARLMGDGETIEIIYVGAKASASTRTIRRQTSTDGITFGNKTTFFEPQVATPNNHGEPCILRDGNNISCWYDCAITNQVRFISQAVSNDNGATWTHRQGVYHPVGGSDRVQVFDSCVVRHNGTAYMFYAGAPLPGAAEGMGAQIFVATAAI